MRQLHLIFSTLGEENAMLFSFFMFVPDTVILVRSFARIELKIFTYCIFWTGVTDRTNGVYSNGDLPRG